MGIIDTMLGRREPAVAYRTVDGGHPAPYPDMTDEQLYNYEIAFDVPRKTFDKPPASTVRATRTAAEPWMNEATQPRQTRSRQRPHMPYPPKDSPTEQARDQTRDQTRDETTAHVNVMKATGMMPLDLTKPVRTITTKQSVEIITTRARHPIYKVHGYIGDDDVLTVFTLDGRLSENGPRFLENMPEKQQLHVNIYRNRDVHSKEKFLLTQHDTQEQADAAATTERIACVRLEFDL